MHYVHTATFSLRWGLLSLTWIKLIEWSGTPSMHYGSAQPHSQAMNMEWQKSKKRRGHPTWSQGSTMSVNTPQDPGGCLTCSNPPPWEPATLVCMPSHMVFANYNTKLSAECKYWGLPEPKSLRQPTYFQSSC